MPWAGETGKEGGVWEREEQKQGKGSQRKKIESAGQGGDPSGTVGGGEQVRATLRETGSAGNGEVEKREDERRRIEQRAGAGATRAGPQRADKDCRVTGELSASGQPGTPEGDRR